jgi:hypothetical protein
MLKSHARGEQDNPYCLFSRVALLSKYVDLWGLRVTAHALT